MTTEQQTRRLMRQGQWASDRGIVELFEREDFGIIGGWLDITGEPDSMLDLIKAAPDLLAATRAAAALIVTARRYFPKSVKNSDRFQLELVSAELGKAIAAATGEQRPAASSNRTIFVEVSGGVCTDVTGLPDGWDYEIIDHDNGNDEDCDDEERAAYEEALAAQNLLIQSRSLKGGGA